jgi:xanthine dehydrogenase accessory factor
MPAEVAKVAESDFVICMTMGHRTDRPILEELFRQARQPAYLGVIGSAAKRKVLLRELGEAGISTDVASNFRCPIGLRLGQNQPGEIAISVTAELIQVRDELSSASR